MQYQGKLSPLYPWMTISGWFDFEDVYKKFATALPNGATFVEVGTFLGRSFAAMDFLAKQQHKDIFLWAVDTFKGSASELTELTELTELGDFYGEFVANMERCGVSNFRTVRETSVKAAKRFADRSVDVVFIDGEHTYDAVCADIQVWRPKVRTANGYLAGHDYDRPEVKKAVLSYFDEDEVVVSGRTWLVQSSGGF
jgi:hypothetical protein